MMTLVYNNLSISRHQVTDFSFSDKTLYHCNINFAIGFILASAYFPNLLRIYTEKEG